MASKRKHIKAVDQKLKAKEESEEDEAFGEELDLDKSSSEDDSDDSSEYSDLEGEDDDGSDSDEDDSGDNSSSDDEKDNPIDNIENAVNEYEYDSSDEEEVRNTIGNVPVNWYDDYKHIGYNVQGEKINKPKRGDELSNFLSRMENPEHGVTVEDSETGQQVIRANICF